MLLNYTYRPSCLFQTVVLRLITDLFINISFIIVKTCHICEYLLAVLIGIPEDGREGRNM